MSFKSNLLLLMSLFFIISCAGEDEPYRRPVQLDFEKVGVGGTCLENFSSTLGLFYEGDISPLKLKEFWSCMERSVKLFVSLTEGKLKKTSYTPKELRNFLQRFFLGKDTLSDGLLESLMGIKKIFVGGRRDQLTRDELLYGASLFKEFSKYTVNLLPYMKLYTNHKDIKKYPIDKIERLIPPALDSIRYVSLELSSLLGRKNQSYSFEDLKKLVFNFLESSDSKNKDKIYHQFIKWLPLYKKIKKVFVGSDETKIQPNEWGRLLKNAFRLLNIKMRSDYFLKGKSWTVGQPLDQLFEVLNVFYKSVDEAIYFHKDRLIPHKEIKAIIREASSHITWPLGLSYKTLALTWEKLIDVVLTPLEDRSVSNDHPKGLDKIVFSELKAEVSRWFVIQEQLNNYDVKSDGSIIKYLESITSVNLSEGISPIDEIKRALSSPYKYLIDDKGRLMLESGILDRDYDHESLFAINWKRAIVRLLMRGYSESKDQYQNLLYLTQKQLESAFKDFFDLIVGIGIADKDEDPVEFVSNLNQLSNLFLLRSDGDENVSFEEGLEYFIFAIGGINSGTYYFDTLSKACPSFTNKSGEVVKDITCVRQQILLDPKPLMGAIPKYLDFFSNLCLKKDINKCDDSDFPDDDDEEEKEPIYSKEDFLNFMELASGRKDSKAPIQMGELSKQMILASYVENYLLLNDQLFPAGNKNGRINLKESLHAYPKFKYILWKIAKKMSSRFKDDNRNGFKMTKGLYTWLMMYGKAPSKFEAIGFWFWYKFKSNWDSIDANRVMLLKILGTLAVESGE